MNPNLKLFFLMLLFWSKFVWAFELSSSLSTEYQSFYLSPEGTSQHLTRLSAQQKGQHEFNSFLSLKLDHSLFLYQIDRDKKKSFRASGDRFGLNSSWASSELFLGLFTVTPDGADINNLFDVVSAKDFSQPFSSKSLGSPGVNFSGALDSLQYQFYYFPVTTKSVLPSLNSLWWPRTGALPIENSEGVFNLPEEIFYQIKSETELESPFLNAFGSQLKWTYENLDLMGFYYVGPNQLPFIYPEFNINVISLDPLIGDIVAPVELNLTWHKSEHVGGGLVYVFDPVILKIFYKSQTDKLPVERKSQHATLTLEHSVPLSTVTLRYFLQANRTWKKSSESGLQTLLGFFEKSTTLGFYLDANSMGLFSGALVYNEEAHGMLSAVNYEYRWSDAIKSKLTWNVLTPSKDLIGQAYDKADNFTVSVSYDWSIF